MEDGIALYVMFRTKAHKDLKALDNQDALRLLESIKKLVNFPDVPNKKGLQILSPHIDFYLRRGYEKTDAYLDFPESDLWNPCSDLKLVVLKKEI